MKNADLPAFAQEEKIGEASIVKGGLTKREHFAGLAMQGVLARGAVSDVDYITQESYRIADVMCAEGDKQQ